MWVLGLTHHVLWKLQTGYNWKQSAPWWLTVLHIFIKAIVKSTPEKCGQRTTVVSCGSDELSSMPMNRGLDSQKCLEFPLVEIFWSIEDPRKEGWESKKTRLVRKTTAKWPKTMKASRRDMKGKLMERWEEWGRLQLKFAHWLEINRQARLGAFSLSVMRDVNFQYGWINCSFPVVTSLSLHYFIRKGYCPLPLSSDLWCQNKSDGWQDKFLLMQWLPGDDHLFNVMTTRWSCHRVANIFVLNMWQNWYFLWTRGIH